MVVVEPVPVVPPPLLLPGFHVGEGLDVVVSEVESPVVAPFCGEGEGLIVVLPCTLTSSSLQDYRGQQSQTKREVFLFNPRATYQSVYIAIPFGGLNDPS